MEKYLKRWNKYNIEVTDDWVEEFSANYNIKPLWYAKLCLTIGLFIQNVIELFKSDGVSE